MPPRLKRKINRQVRRLMTLADLTYATSDQINGIERLGSDRNARRILYEMEKDRLIDSVRHGCKVYFNTRKGSDLIGRSNPRLKRSEVEHSLLRNDAYALLGYPRNWRKEVPIKKNGELFVRADAVYSKDGRIYFVEIDNRATMQTNIAKIKRYSTVFTSLRADATLVWYTLVNARKKRLAETCDKFGINYRIL